MKEKRKDSKRKRKLLLAIIMVLFIGVILTTSTYAWFTANQTVTVEDINVNVATSKGIQISVDGLDWRALVTNDQIRSVGTSDSTYPTAINQLPNEMYPVSTIGTLDTNGFMKMYKGLITPDDTTGINELNSTASVETNGTDGDFVAFDLFFKVTNDDPEYADGVPIYLTNDSNVVTSDATSKGLENAARIGFIIEGNTGSSSTASTIQGLKDASATPIIWELNNDVHTQSGINNGYVYLYDVPGDVEELEEGHNHVLAASGEDAIIDSYYGVNAEFEGEALNSHDSSKFGLVTPSFATGVSGIPSDEFLHVFDLKPGITKVRIYMWVEGQDVDCEDSASGSNLTYSLKFSTLEAA